MRRWGEVTAELLEGEWIGFDKGKFMVAGDGKADGADTRIEVENTISSDMFLDDAEGEFVDGKIDLEETIRGIGIGMAENLVGERREIGVRMAVFVETTRNFTRLVGAKKNRLIPASLFVMSIEIGDDLRGGLENFGVFE